MKIPIILATVAAAAVVLAGCGGDESAAPTTSETTTTSETSTQATTTESTTDATTSTDEPPAQTITIVVTNGKPQGGIRRPSVKKGDRVVIVVRSDVADEVHLHGYDISRDVKAGGTIRIRFTATIPGRFEVELEDLGLQVAELTVTP